MDSFDWGFVLGHVTGIVLGAWCAWYITSAYDFRLFRRWLDELDAEEVGDGE